MRFTSKGTQIALGLPTSRSLSDTSATPMWSVLKKSLSCTCRHSCDSPRGKVNTLLFHMGLVFFFTTLVLNLLRGLRADHTCVRVEWRMLRWNTSRAHGPYRASEGISLRGNLSRHLVLLVRIPQRG